MLTEPDSPAAASGWAAGRQAAACWRPGDVARAVWAVPVRPSAVRPQVSAARVAAHRRVVAGSGLVQWAAPGLRVPKVQAEAVRERRVSRGTSPAEGEVGPAQASAEVTGDRMVREEPVAVPVPVPPPRAEVRSLASAEALRLGYAAVASAPVPERRMVPEPSAAPASLCRTRRTATTPRFPAAVRPRASSVRSPEAATPPTRGTSASRPTCPTRGVRASPDKSGKYPHVGDQRCRRIIRSAPSVQG